MSDSQNPRRFNLSRWALEHQPLTRYLMVVLMVLGIAAYFQLGQDEDPPFNFRAMVVSAYWPGASAREMAEQVSDRLEKVLQEVPHTDIIRSYSKPGHTLIVFQIADSAPPKDIQQVWYTTRKKLNDARGQLPQGVQGPFFNDEFGDVYGVLYALSGEGFGPAELKAEADRIRQSLLRVRDVGKVEVMGDQEEQIQVDVSRHRLATLGLDLQQVASQLAAQNAVTAAGVIEAGSEALPVRVQGALQSVDEVRQLPVRTPQGVTLRLGELAEVNRGYADPPRTRIRHNGQDSVVIGVSMTRGGDVIAMGKALHAEMDRLTASLPVGMRLDTVQFQPDTVARSVNEFVKVLIEAVVVVLAVSFLSLGLHHHPHAKGWRRYSLDVRPGLVVFITIPLVLAVTFLIMYYWGIGLHKISLGSLIIALGLLVDDAIIAVEMMVRKLEEGHTLMRAATFTWEVTAMPMLTGTLITAAGFLPIGFARSTVGEYTFAIFAVTAAALVVSWVVAVYFVPYLGVRFLRVKAHAGPVEEVFDGAFYRRFRALVGWCVDHYWLTIGITLLTFVMGLWGMTRVQQQFFPDSDRPEVLIDVWQPEGATFAANEALARRMESGLQQLAGVQQVTGWTGSGFPRFYLPLDQIMPQSNVSQILVMPVDLAARQQLLQSLPQWLNDHFPEVRSRVKLLAAGPPVAYPVQFRVSGPDPVQLRRRADEVATLMRQSPRLRGVNDNWNESVRVWRLEVDQDRARALGVSSADIAQLTQTSLSGRVLGQYREGDRLLNIVLRQPESERLALDNLSNLYVASSHGRAVPLSQVARAVVDWEPGVLWREGRQFAITVQADTATGVQGATVTAELLPAVRALEAGWAQQDPAYRIEVAGAVAESSKGQGSIAAGMPMMLFVTFTLLMLQLQSFARALLVFLTGPLGLAGVAAALLLLNRPFGFVALLGVIALMGMIMRNSVILIDQIEQDRRAGVAAREAVVESAVRRLRPIVLTAAAAVLAMIPLSRSVFWGPMAVAIMGGLVVATVLTLLALPAMYAAWFRVHRSTVG